MHALGNRSLKIALKSPPELRIQKFFRIRILWAHMQRTLSLGWYRVSAIQCLGGNEMGSLYARIPLEMCRNGTLCSFGGRDWWIFWMIMCLWSVLMDIVDSLSVWRRRMAVFWDFVFWVKFPRKIGTSLLRSWDELWMSFLRESIYLDLIPNAFSGFFEILNFVPSGCPFVFSMGFFHGQNDPFCACFVFDGFSILKWVSPFDQEWSN